jgi:carboxyl-terminal processing protease
VWKTTQTRRGLRNSAARVLILVAMLVATALGAYMVGRSQSPATLGEEDRKSLALYAEALDTVRNNYVDQKDIHPKKETYGAIEGMLDSLGDDGHTRFLTPEEREQNDQSLSGTYVGIGVQLEEKNGEVVVAAPIEGSPAEKAGISSGDVLLAVDGKSIRDESVSEVVRKVKGPEGSTVVLTVRHEGEKRNYDLQRAEIKSPVVSWVLIPDTNVALVLLSSFSDDSAGELEDAFQEARAAGARRFILDLRNNPGGRLDQAVEMAGYFLEPESVVYIRKDASGEREEITVEGDPESTDAQLVVLVNGSSASSAEILAGALRDNGRARRWRDHLRHRHRALGVRSQGRIIHPARRRRVANPGRRFYPRNRDNTRRASASRGGNRTAYTRRGPRSLQTGDPREGCPTARGL